MPVQVIFQSMIQALSIPRDIASAQRKFARMLRTGADERVKVKIPIDDKLVHVPVFWSEKHKFWCSFVQSGARFVNVFGLEKPRPDNTVSIACEINVPAQGTNRAVGGVFARQDKTIAVVHRGKMGGGRETIGRSLFLTHYLGARAHIAEENGTSPVLVVAEPASERFMQQVGQFVHEVERIKTLALLPDMRPVSDSEAVLVSADPDAIAPEGLGQACDRLIIAHSLAAHFTARAYTVRPAAGNLLYTIDRSGDVRHLVAIAFSNDFAALAASLGRLLLLKARLCRPLSLIMALPHAMILDNAKALSHYTVCGVPYAWQGNDISFEGLSEAL